MQAATTNNLFVKHCNKLFTDEKKKKGEMKGKIKKKKMRKNNRNEKKRKVM